MEERQQVSLVSIVVPMFNEREVVGSFHERITTALSSAIDLDYDLIFVDDGSTDESFDIAEDLARTDPRVSVVKLSRNFGHQIAISAGLNHANGDCVVIIDIDLQDPPEMIPRMVEKWRQGFDVVYGVRTSRHGESFLKLATARAFYKLLSTISRIDIPANVGDFRLISRRVNDQLRTMREKDRYVRGLSSWVGYRQTGIEYTREERVAGTTKYPYRKMIKFALDGVTSFSTVPLRLAMWLGYATSLLAFLYLASVFVQKLLGITVQGWATIMVAVLFLGGVQLICMGILGEYIGRIFKEIKPRPMYNFEKYVKGGANDLTTDSESP